MKLLRKAIEVEHWSSPATFGHLMLRAVTALMLFWFHGWHKLLEAVAFIRTGQSWRLVDEIAEMHFPAPEAIAFFATAVQFICSLLLTVGLFTRLNALLLAAILGGAVLQNSFCSAWRSGAAVASPSTQCCLRELDRKAVQEMGVNN